MLMMLIEVARQMMVLMMAEWMIDRRHQMPMNKQLLLWTRMSMDESVTTNDAMDGEEN